MLESHGSLAEKFLRKGFWIYFFGFLAGPVGYLIKIVLSGDLSVEEIGLLYGVISFVTLIGAYNDLWMTESLNYFLPRYIVSKDYNAFKTTLAYAFFAQVLTSILIGILLFFGAGYLASEYFHYPEATTVIEIFCLFFLAMNLFQILNTVFSVVQNTKIQKWVEFIRMLFVFFFVILLWKSNAGNLVTYSWAWIGGLIIGILASFYVFYTQYYRTYLADARITFDRALLKEMFSYAAWVFLATNIGMLLSQVDMQLIIFMLGAESAGYYTNYLSLMHVPFLLITPIIGFIFPVISELHKNHQDEKIQAIKSFFSKYFSVAAVFIGAFMFVFGTELAYVLFGTKFIPSGEILKYSSGFLIFNFLLQLNFQILAGVGLAKNRAKILFLGLIFNVVLNIILIRALGVVWSALAVWISWIPIFLMSEFMTRKYALVFDWYFFIKNLFITLILSLGWYYFFLPLLSGASRAKTLIFLLIIIFFHIIIASFLNRREVSQLFQEIRTIRKK